MDRVEMFSGFCDKIDELHKKKNNDYGNAFGENFQELGEYDEKYSLVYAFGHMKEKLKRIESLSFGTQMVKEESLEDSLLDLASYALMTLVELKYDR